MREKIKQILLIFFFIIVILFPLNADARSGCCSWHGGVCGYRCCDGTALSTTCAPYYPNCNEETVPPPTTTTTTVPPKLLLQQQFLQQQPLQLLQQ